MTPTTPLHRSATDARRRSTALVAVAGLLGCLALGVAAAPAGAADPLGRFRPLTSPLRILDTRDLASELVHDAVVQVPVAGSHGIPGSAVAAVVTITALAMPEPGYVTAWPAGEARPITSNLNVSFAGQAVANLATVKLGTGGAMQLYTQSGGHLLVDVTGWFEPAGATETSGRFVPAPATTDHLVDTRDGTGVSAPGRLTPNATIDVDLAAGGVPADALAAVAAITVEDATAPGYVAAWPAGQAAPATSNLNVNAVGQTVAGVALVGLGAGGDWSVTTQGGGHLVVDVLGWFTGPSAPAASTGLLLPASPARLVDTRDGRGVDPSRAGRKVGPGDTLAATLAAAPAGAVAALANVTVTTPPVVGGIGLGSVDGGGPVLPFDADDVADTMAHTATLPLGVGGTTSLTTRSGGHLIVDVNGWFVA